MTGTGLRWTTAVIHALLVGKLRPAILHARPDRALIALLLVHVAIELAPLQASAVVLLYNSAQLRPLGAGVLHAQMPGGTRQLIPCAREGYGIRRQGFRILGCAGRQLPLPGPDGPEHLGAQFVFARGVSSGTRSALRSRDQRRQTGLSAGSSALPSVGDQQTRSFG